MQKNKNKPNKKKKPPFVSKLYWAEPAVTLAMLLMFAPSFHKVLQRHHSGHPDSSFMQCYEMLIRSCFPKSCSTTLQRRGGEEEVGRKKERKSAKGHIDIFGATSCTLLLLDKRRGRGSWSRQQQSRSAFWKKEGMQSTQLSNMHANEC